MLPVTYSECNVAVEGMSSSSSAEQSRRSRSKFSSKPSWLLLSISDMEDKIQELNGEYKSDTFGERADFYYRKRPELLALLQDLYNRYLYLADRYTRALSKQQRQEHVHNQQLSTPPVLDDNNIKNLDYSDDAESSLSYEPPLHPQKPDKSELVVSELVMKFIEYEIAVDELQTMDSLQEESKKKIQIQKSLLDVLESERVVLTNENSRLASESLFMKRKAGELARCVLLERTEDQRVFVLSRKIDDLQAQILELEKRNKEYYDKLTKHQEDVNKNEGGKKNISINIKRLMVKSSGGGSGSNSSISWSGGEEDTGCSMSSTSNSSTCTSLAQVMKDNGGGKKRTVRKEKATRGGGWWDRMKKCDMFMCGPHLDATTC